MMLSVVVPFYQNFQSLRLMLESLCGQDLERDKFEVIVVDDGSEDDALQDIDPLLRMLPLTLLKLGKNKGRAAARNAGLTVAKGSSILFLDADSFASPGLLRTHLEFQIANRNSVLYGYRHEVNWDTFSRIRQGVFPGFQELPSFDQDIRWLAFNNGRYQKAPWAFFHTHNVSLPRKLLELAGGFDEDYRKYGYEDIDLGLRLCRASGSSTKFHFSSKASCYHLPHFKNFMTMTNCLDENWEILSSKHPGFEVELSKRTFGNMQFDSTAYFRSMAHKAGSLPRAPSKVGGVVRSLRGPRLLYGRLRTLAPADLNIGITEEGGGAKGCLGLSLAGHIKGFRAAVSYDLWRALPPAYLAFFIEENVERCGRLLLLASSISRGPRGLLWWRDPRKAEGSFAPLGLHKVIKMDGVFGYEFQKGL